MVIKIWEPLQWGSEIWNTALKWEEFDKWNRIENKHCKEQFCGEDDGGVKLKEELGIGG